MNLKHSLKRAFAVLKQQKSSTNKQDTMVTPKKTFALEKNQSFIEQLSILKRPCTRCLKIQAQFNCSQCTQSYFCTDCDCQIHSVGKFLNHRRNYLPPLKEIETNSRTRITKKYKDSEEECKIDQIKSLQINTNISQNWQKISSQINSKFQAIIDDLQDKRKQIMLKINAKKQKELKLYNQAFAQWQEIVMENKNYNQGKLKKYYIDKCEKIHQKIKYLENQSLQDKIEKKCEQISMAFQNIQVSLAKFDIKNVLSRPQAELCIQVAKKPMKSSLIVGSTTSTATSPNTKTPNNMKSPLSQSTLEPDVKQNSEKTSQEGRKLKISYLEKEIKLLSKVRSQKLFCKSPKNFQNYEKERILTIKKTVKMEQ